MKIEKAGVAPKQKDKARQVMQRSATQAGYFAFGNPVACNDWAVGELRKNAVLVLGIKTKGFDQGLAYLKMSPSEVSRLVARLNNALEKLS